MAGENASHAPGNEIRGEGAAVRQRQRMGQGKGPMPASETFGVGPIPGTHHLQGHGDHVPHDGVHLHDEHRSNPPGIPQGDGQMHATHHSHHGPHHHHGVEMAAMRGGVPHRGRGKH